MKKKTKRTISDRAVNKIALGARAFLNCAALGGAVMGAMGAGVLLIVSYVDMVKQ